MAYQTSLWKHWLQVSCRYKSLTHMTHTHNTPLVAVTLGSDHLSTCWYGSSTISSSSRCFYSSWLVNSVITGCRLRCCHWLCGYWDLLWIFRRTPYERSFIDLKLQKHHVSTSYVTFLQWTNYQRLEQTIWKHCYSSHVRWTASSDTLRHYTRTSHLLDYVTLLDSGGREPLGKPHPVS